jgi:hypothetical protein
MRSIEGRLSDREGARQSRVIPSNGQRSGIAHPVVGARRVPCRLKQLTRVVLQLPSLLQAFLFLWVLAVALPRIRATLLGMIHSPLLVVGVLRIAVVQAPHNRTHLAPACRVPVRERTLRTRSHAAHGTSLPST